MGQIILDISANTHKNDITYFKRMIDELKDVDAGKHEVIIKHQLFKTAGDNTPTYHGFFEEAYIYAGLTGYKTTSSVFDLESLRFLLGFDIPFVKVANNRELYWLIGEVPRKVPVYVSIDVNKRPTPYNSELLLQCVSKYPANVLDYDYNPYCSGISDHTTNWDLYHKRKPKIYECHYKLQDSTGMDAGDFARTPDQLREIL